MRLLIEKWRLLLTRPMQESISLAIKLRTIGVHASVLPMLQIRALQLNSMQYKIIKRASHYRAIIFISKPAALLGIKLIRKGKGLRQKQEWFAIGPATAKVFSDHRLEITYPSEDSNSESLLSLLQLKLCNIDLTSEPKVMIVRGRNGREKLGIGLTALGFKVDYLEIYQRERVEYISGDIYQKYKINSLNAVHLSSSEGFRYLHQLFDKEWNQIKLLTFFTPSQRIADIVRRTGVKKVINCHGAGKESLLLALSKNTCLD